MRHARLLIISRRGTVSLVALSVVFRTLIKKTITGHRRMPKKAMFCSLNSYNVAEGRDRVDGWLSVLQLDDLD